MENWKVEILENLVEIDSEQLSNATDKDYSFYYIDISSVSSGMISFPSHTTAFDEAPSRARKVLRERDILMSSVRPNLKAFARFNSPDNNSQFIASTGFAVLSEKNDTDIDYIYHCLFSSPIENQIMSLVVGSNYPALNTRDIRKLKIFLPKEKSEQTKIASILSTIDEATSQTEKLISKYQRIKTGMMQDLLTKGIDAKGNIRSKDTHKFVVKNGIEVPEEWEVVRFGDYIELVHGYQFRNYDFTIDGVAVVKIGEVKPEGVDLLGCSFVAEKRLEEFPKQQIKNGDILMALTGATLGKACLVGNISVPLLQNYRVGKFEPKFDDFDKRYIYFCLKTDLILNQIFNKVNSGAQGNIGKTDFENVWIRQPTVEEQIRIAERLFSLDKTMESETNYLNKLHSIKIGLMQDLLSGKVRVK